MLTRAGVGSSCLGTIAPPWEHRCCQLMIIGPSPPPPAVRLSLRINCCNPDLIRQTQEETDGRKKESVMGARVGNEHMVSFMAAHKDGQWNVLFTLFSSLVFSVICVRRCAVFEARNIPEGHLHTAHLREILKIFIIWNLLSEYESLPKISPRIMELSDKLSGNNDVPPTGLSLKIMGGLM